MLLGGGGSASRASRTRQAEFRDGKGTERNGRSASQDRANDSNRPKKSEESRENQRETPATWAAANSKETKRDENENRI